MDNWIMDSSSRTSRNRLWTNRYSCSIAHLNRDWNSVKWKTRYHADRRKRTQSYARASLWIWYHRSIWGPSVSTATGTKVIALDKSAYLRILASAANSVTAPETCTVLFKCVSASESKKPWHPRQDSCPQTTRQDVSHQSFSNCL